MISHPINWGKYIFYNLDIFLKYLYYYLLKNRQNYNMSRSVRINGNKDTKQNLT